MYWLIVNTAKRSAVSYVLIVLFSFMICYVKGVEDVLMEGIFYAVLRLDGYMAGALFIFS